MTMECEFQRLTGETAGRARFHVTERTAGRDLGEYAAVTMEDIRCESPSALA